MEKWKMTRKLWVYITRKKVSSHLLTFMLRRTRSTGKCVFTGLASGGINPLEYIYGTLIVPDGGLEGGVYGSRGFQQEICKDAVVRRTVVLPQYRGVSQLYAMKSRF